MYDLYDCVCTWTTLESGPAIVLQKMAILEKKNIFSDEAHFELGGYVNKQNCRIGGIENPRAYIEKPTHPKRVFVWCGFWSRGIIGPFFFENEQGEAVTVDGDRCRAMMNEFLFTKIEDRIISRRADVVWSPRSSDLTPLDYYLWGAVKDKCYADKPETIDALKHNIREAIGEI